MNAADRILVYPTEAAEFPCILLQYGLPKPVGWAHCAHACIHSVRGLVSVPGGSSTPDITVTRGQKNLPTLRAFQAAYDAVLRGIGGQPLFCQFAVVMLPWVKIAFQVVEQGPGAEPDQAVAAEK